MSLKTLNAIAYDVTYHFLGNKCNYGIVIYIVFGNTILYTVVLPLPVSDADIENVRKRLTKSKIQEI